MAGEEGEALGLLAEEAAGEVTVAKADLAVVGYGTGDTEGLEADADSLGSVSSVLASLLEGDGGTDYVSPLGVLEADTLGLFAGDVRVEAVLFANLVGFFDGSDAVGIEGGENLLLAAVL